MKYFKVFFWSLLTMADCINLYSQSIELRGGQSLTPALYAGIHYSHYTNSEVNLAATLFTENFTRNSLRYSSYGVDLVGEYATNRGDNSDNVLIGYLALGLAAQVENEPWIYKDKSFTERINYGIAGEIKGEWLMTKIFGLSVFGQQKYLFNKALGTTQFNFGIGLSYHFNN